MTQSIMTVEEMMADLSTIHDKPSTSINPMEIGRTDSSFLLTQFQLLATPYFVIYLQGKKGSSLALLTNPTESELLALAFHEAIFRRVGRNVPTTITGLLPHIETNKAKFYSDKEWHKAILIKLIESHSLPIVKDLTATRAYPLAAIESYLTALASYLVSNNISSVEEWNTNKTNLNLHDSTVWDDL